MPAQVPGQYYLELSLANQLYPAGPSSVPRIFEMNNISHHVPSVLMYIDDRTGELMNNYSLGDGVPIAITSTSDPSQFTPPTTTYRMLGQPKLVSRGSSTLAILGYLDVPKYLRQMAQTSYTGTSAEAFKQLANDCGLTTDIDDTNDSMTWLSNLKTYAQLARNICDYSWASETSAMGMAVDRNKVIHLKDMATLVKGNPSVLFYMGNKPQTNLNSYQIVQYRPKDQSGVLNHWMGYGANTNQVGIDGTFNTYNAVTATKLSNDLNVNTDVQSIVNKLVRSVYCPPNTGNGHQNYFKAYHQNQRLRSLFSTDLDIMVMGDVNCDLFDLATADIIDSTTYQSNPAYQGVYIITAKTRTVWNDKFLTRLQLSTQGTNIAGLSDI